MTQLVHVVLVMEYTHLNYDPRLQYHINMQLITTYVSAAHTAGTVVMLMAIIAVIWYGGR